MGLRVHSFRRLLRAVLINRQTSLSNLLFQTADILILGHLEMQIKRYDLLEKHVIFSIHTVEQFPFALAVGDTKRKGNACVTFRGQGPRGNFFGCTRQGKRYEASKDKEDLSAFWCLTVMSTDVLKRAERKKKNTDICFLCCKGSGQALRLSAWAHVTLLLIYVMTQTEINTKVKVKGKTREGKFDVYNLTLFSMWVCSNCHLNRIFHLKLVIMVIPFMIYCAKDLICHLMKWLCLSVILTLHW